MAPRGEREVRVKFTGENSSIKGVSGEVARIFQRLVDDVDDVRGAGEKLADAQKRVADSITREYEKIDTAVMAVKDSLGVEMVRAIESSGRSVEGQVQEWRRLGLTLDDITRDSDQLVAGMRELDTAARRSAGEVGDGFKKIANEADNSRSVVANFAGNAIAELPGITNAMGPLNMAIGQFAEYATEGNIRLKNLLATGAGIGVAALAMQALADRAKKLNEVKAFESGQVEGYSAALEEAATRAEAIADHLREVEKIQVSIGADGDFWTGGITGLVDLTGAYTALGLQVNDVARIMDGGEEGIDAWGAAMIASGAEAGVVTTAMYGMKQQLEAVTTAAENNQRTQAFLGETLADVTYETDRGKDSLNKHTSETERNRLAQEALTFAFERNEEAQQRLTDTRLAAIDQDFAFRNAQDQLTQAMENLATATDDPKTAVNELRQSQDDAAQAAIGMAENYRLSAEQLAASAGAPLTAAEGQQKFIESLYQTALSLDPASPLRTQLVEYINMLQADIPAEAKSKIILDAEDANTRIGFHRQKNVDAKTAVDDLSDALGLLPGYVDIPLSIPGYTTVMSQLLNLKTRLGEVETAASRADSAVARVAD